MAVFELQANGKTFEVDAPTMEAAAASLNGGTQPAKNADTALDSYRRGLPMLPRQAPYAPSVIPGLGFAVPTPPKTGAEAGAGLPGYAFPYPKTVGAAVSEVGNAIGGIPTGIYGGIRGSLGDAEAFARMLLGKPGQTAFKTTSEAQDAIAGPAAPGAEVGRALGNMMGPGLLLRGLQGAMRTGVPPAPPENKAISYVQKLGATPEALEAAQGSKPITSAEALGSNAQTNLMAAARREGDTGAALQAQLTERAQGRSDRILTDMANASGIEPDAARGNLDAVLAQGKAQAKPLYDAAFARPQTAMWSPRLQDFLDQPETKAGLARGLQIQRLEAVTEGRPFNPSDYAVRGIEDDGTPIIGWSKNETLARGGELAPGQFDIPNLRSMDAIKRGLDAMVEDYRNPTTGRLVLDEKGRALNNFRKAFVGELDKVAPPEYAQARSTASDYLSAQTAFDQGGKAILNGKLTEAQFNKMVGSMSPPELEALKGGIANKLFDLAQNTPVNRTMNVNQLITPRAQAKLSIALGPNQAQAFTDNLLQEMQMRNFEQSALPRAGSQTTPLAEANKAQDAFGGNAMIDNAVNAAIQSRGNPKRALTGMLNEWAGSKVQPLLDAMKTRGLSVADRNEMGRLLLLPPAQLAATLRSAPPRSIPLAPAPVNNFAPALMSPAILTQLLSQAAR